jgi:peptide chain release factor 2
VIAEANAHRAVIEPFDGMVARLEDCDVMLELLEMEEDEAEIAKADAELEQQLEAVRKLFEEMELKSLLGGKFDANNCYLTINAGAGGTESCDWASMLYRQYYRFAERQGFKVQVLDSQDGEEAGIKSVSMLIEGPYAYGFLKAERGVHRLVRISPFDSAGRRHTSFTAIDVVAEIDQTVNVEIIDSDLRIDTFRASGAGGQHVNTTDSAVRITHIPSGIVVQCQSERSQHSNRDKSMKMLAAKLYEWEMDKKRKEVEKFYDPKGSIAWGSQIRSYVLQPYTMVKDHRTNAEMGNTQAVLDGDLMSFVEAYLKQNRKTDS